MTQRGGFTVVEMMVSSAMFVILLGTASVMLTTDTTAFWTNEATTHAHQTARNAADILQQDLAGAQIYSYFVNGSGNALAYLKFRRVELAGGVFLSGDKVRWEAMSAMRMYIWCRNTTGNPCNQIQPAPLPDQLLLVQAGAGNTNGELNLPWVRERVVAHQLDLQEFTANNVLPFTVAIFQADGTALPQMNAAGCAAPSPNGSSETCVNRRAHSPSATAFATSGADLQPAYLRVIVRIRSQQPLRRTPAAMQRDLWLRNPQAQQ